MKRGKSGKNRLSSPPDSHTHTPETIMPVQGVLETANGLNSNDEIRGSSAVRVINDSSRRPNSVDYGMCE